MDDENYKLFRMPKVPRKKKEIEIFFLKNWSPKLLQVDNGDSSSKADE